MGGALNLYHTNLNGFKIIGEGMGIGSKARDLANAAPRLQEIGFKIPETVVLPEEYFNNYFHDNNIGASLREITPSPEIEQAVLNGSLSENYMRDLTVISNYYDWAPLSVRSSAEGDSRGTGIYLSDFCNNKPEYLANSIKKVLASYFSEDAVEFRKNAMTGEGFGIMIQNIVGEMHGDYGFAPVISGYGYSDSHKYGAYIDIVPFLGGGVSDTRGERISFKDFPVGKGLLFRKYISDRIKDLSNSRISWRDYPNIASYTKFTAFGKICIDYKGINFDVYDNKLSEPTDYLRMMKDELRALNKWDLENMLSKLCKINQVFSNPQYFEFASTLNSEKGLDEWILQISDVDPVKSDILNFALYDQILLSANCARGAGIKYSNTILDLNMHKSEYVRDELNLWLFNKQFKDYILIVPASLTTTYAKNKLTYREYSNASVIIELSDELHADRAVSHFEGTLEGKYFGELKTWKAFELNEIIDKGFPIYRGNFKIAASVSQDRMIIVNDSNNP